MNFLGLGPGELMLILVLGLIIFGPGKLPEIAGQIGRAVRDFRQSTSEISSEFQRSFSLEESPPPPQPVGAATVFASNGVAAAEDASPASSGEVPLADTSNWHWESGEQTVQAPESSSAANAVEAKPESASSFWSWDAEPSPTTAESSTAGASTVNAEAAPATGSVWQWDSEPVVSGEAAATSPAPDRGPLAASPPAGADSALPGQPNGSQPTERVGWEQPPVAREAGEAASGHGDAKA